MDHRGALAVLATHRTEGVERVDHAGVTRLLQVGDDDHVVTAVPDAAGVVLTVDTADDWVHAALIERTRHWFDLDADVRSIDAALATSAVFVDHVARRPGMRVTRGVDAFESVVETVLGQQVTVAAARRFGARLVAAYGSDGRSGLRRFPRPADLAAVPVDELRATLRVTGARARTVGELARLFLHRAPADPLPDHSTLAAVYGIGPWTLDYLAVRAGDDPDVFPANDAVLRRMIAAHGLDDGATDQWRPYRSYAAVRLWAMSGATG